jgi:hypothetical protein
MKMFILVTMTMYVGKATSKYSALSLMFFGHVFSSECGDLHIACVPNYLAKIKLKYGARICQLLK